MDLGVAATPEDSLHDAVDAPATSGAREPVHVVTGGVERIVARGGGRIQAVDEEARCALRAITLDRDEVIGADVLSLEPPRHVIRAAT